jgi:glycosyltransferase involved in cell wall biosynthesis
MRIAISITDPQSLRLLWGFPSYLASHGNSVAIISPASHGDCDQKNDEEVAFVRVPFRREVSVFSDLAALWTCILRLHEMHPAVLVASTPKAALISMIAGAVTGVRKRIYLVRGLPLETQTGVMRLILWVCEFVTARLATVVVPVSESLRDALIDLQVVEPRACMVLGSGSSNGVDTVRYQRTERVIIDATAERRRLGIGGGCEVVGFVGRLANDKGLDVVGEVWERVVVSRPNAHLVLVGGVDSRDPASAHTLALLGQLRNVHFLGVQADLRALYGMFDLLLFPSRREGFPNVVLEAAAMGCPAVVSSATGCRDSVIEGKTGFVCSQENVGAFVSAVLALLENPVRRSRFGSAARERVVRDFNREIVWRNWLQLLKDPLEDGEIANQKCV